MKAFFARNLIISKTLLFTGAKTRVNRGDSFRLYLRNWQPWKTSAAAYLQSSR